MLQSFVAEIESAVSGEGASRALTVRRLADLFLEQASSLSEEHVGVFDEVIARLARDLESRARAQLSEQFADVANAPRATVKDLAFDSAIEVARPVLERSRRLSEGELVEIARMRGQEHLLALSRRSSLPEKLTDVLVDRGDRIVVRSVAGNSGARFSASGLSMLMTKAREDDRLGALLTARTDLPPGSTAALSRPATDRAGSEAGDSLGRAAAPKQAHGGRLQALEQAALAIKDEASHGKLDEDRVAALIREGRIDEALAGVAELADVPLAMVASAYDAPGHDTLMFIVRSLGFGWIVFKLLLTHKAGRQPSYDVMRSAFDGYQQLSIATAQRVVRFTAARDFAGESAA